MENTRVLWLYIILLCHYHWFFEEIDGLVNLALKKPAIQSSTFSNWIASLATDGLIGTDAWKNECTHTDINQHDPNPWWEVDLGGVHTINRVSVLNRATSAERLRDINITVISQDKTVTTECAFYQGSVAAAAWATVTCQPGTSGRFVRIQIYNVAYRDALTLCEVVVEGLSPCEAVYQRKHPGQRLNSQLVEEIQSNKPIDCAMACFFTTMCFAYNYNSDTSACQLLKIGDPCDTTVSDPGWNFYSNCLN